MEVSPADIEWRKGIPFSLEFDDFYFSIANALQESQYVFLDQNNLTCRWQALEECERNFNIAELGFGAGLNFLSCCKLWLQTAPSHSTLNYYSVESRPLRLSDLTKILKLWPSLASLSSSLIDQYPSGIKGFHNIELFNGRIRLCLMLGDAQQMLTELGDSDLKGLYLHSKEPINAWFLDGFSPSKNPDIWTTHLFQTIAFLSSSTTTLSTYSAATEVAKNLSNVGFNVEHIKGFGKKRQMIRATFSRLTIETEKIVGANQWHLDSQVEPKNNKLLSATIIGAGIAGCTTAAALVKRGYEVTIIDRHTKAGQGGSGNNKAIVYPKLSLRDDALPRVNLSALLFASRYYNDFWDEGLGQRCGVIVLPKSSIEENAFRELGKRFIHHPDFVQSLDSSKLSDISGINLTSNYGLYFPRLGWLPPAVICDRLLKSEKIHFIENEVGRFCRETPDSLWSIYDNQSKLLNQSNIVVIANAHGSIDFEQTKFFGVKKLRGQVTELPATESSTNLKTVICGHGYITPSHQGIHSCGATYNQNVLTTQLRSQDHQKNIEQLAQTDSSIAQILKELDIGSLDGRANFRCTTRDYLPIVGPVPDVTKMISDFKFLRTDARKTSMVKGTYLSGLFINCGMGSRGLSYAPLTAEILASEIDRQLPPIERELRQAMHPGRFIIRDLKKKRI